MNNTHSDRTAVQIVVATLRQSIERGALCPGDKLPTLKEMETMYCASRIVIREAIKVLEGEGLLYSRQGSGIYVTPNPLLGAQETDRRGTYSLYEIFSLLEYIFDYACFTLKEREDLSEIQELQKLNRDMRQDHAKLTLHQKFVYEATFGARLVCLSGNALAADLYLMLMKPVTSMDYMMIVENDFYREILQIDQYFIEALLNRDPHRASLWGHERNQISLRVIEKSPEFLERKHAVFH